MEEPQRRTGTYGTGGISKKSSNITGNAMNKGNLFPEQSAAIAVKSHANAKNAGQNLQVQAKTKLDSAAFYWQHRC
jgi:hypothetical protein